MAVKEVAKKATKYSDKTIKNLTGSDDGKSLFFLILASCCIWLILDMFYGRKILQSIAENIFGITSDSDIVSDAKTNKILSEGISKSEFENAGEGGQKVLEDIQDVWDKENTKGTDGFGGSGGTKESTTGGSGGKH